VKSNLAKNRISLFLSSKTFCNGVKMAFSSREVENLAFVLNFFNSTGRSSQYGTGLICGKCEINSPFDSNAELSHFKNPFVARNIGKMSVFFRNLLSDAD